LPCGNLLRFKCNSASGKRLTCHKVHGNFVNHNDQDKYEIVLPSTNSANYYTCQYQTANKKLVCNWDYTEETEPASEGSASQELEVQDFEVIVGNAKYICNSISTYDIQCKSTNPAKYPKAPNALEIIAPSSDGGTQYFLCEGQGSDLICATEGPNNNNETEVTYRKIKCICKRRSCRCKHLQKSSYYSGSNSRSNSGSGSGSGSGSNSGSGSDSDSGSQEMPKTIRRTIKKTTKKTIKITRKTTKTTRRTTRRKTSLCPCKK
jgi:uncharacterized membrane protein YgcG